MKIRFQTHVLAIFLPLLLVVQGATILVVYNTTRHHIADQSRKALIATSTSFEHWLDETVARLGQSSAIIAADFGFRSAIGSRDAPTIRSALENARDRINADEILLIGLNGEIQSAPSNETIELTPFPDADLLEVARHSGRAAALIEIRDRVYQYVVVPVRAPDVIAWIGVGVRVTDAAAAFLKAGSTIPVEVTFAYARPHGPWTPVATTLPANRVAALQTALANMPAATVSRQTEISTSDIELDGETYTTSIELLNDVNSRTSVAAVIQYSINAALAPHAPLFIALFALAGAGFLVAVVATVVMARGVTRPIRALDAAARQIQSGHYDEMISVDGPLEVKRLATTFNHMARGIAAREQKIERQANYDELTGLPNRYFLERLLHDEIRLANERHFTLFAINLRSFAEIDHTLGHELGDELLRDAAERIAGSLKKSDQVFRFDRDKFVALGPVVDAAAIELIVGRIHLAFDSPYSVSGINVDVGIQVGVASFPEHGNDHRTLLRHLEIAAESASGALEAFVRYDPKSDRYTAERLAMMSELREGLNRNELELHYQPKIDLQSLTTGHAEALMRWNHPERGLVSPDEFIGIAERTGFIRHLTRWALTTAIEACAYWRGCGYSIVISVNVSAKDLVDPTLPSFIIQELTRCGLGTDAIVLEITENAVMERPEFAIDLLRSLASMNLQISIDDFGTGQSSMAYVKKLPAKELKIDKSFVTDLAHHAEDQAVVRNAIQLGRDLGMRVTAEGIEDAYTAEYLKAHGCDYGQGWYFSKPMPQAAFTRYLFADNTKTSSSPTNVTQLRP